MPAAKAGASTSKRMPSLLFLPEKGALRVVTDKNEETEDGTMFPVMKGKNG
jgi:hypothetical protein